MKAEGNNIAQDQEWLLPLKEEQRLVAKPAVHEADQKEICYRLIDSVQYEYALLVEWWHPAAGFQLGRLRTMWGWVKEIDARYDRIQLINDEESQWIDIGAVIFVKKSP